MRRRLPAYMAAALALMLLGAEPAAGDDSSEQEQAEELAREAMEQFMRALKMFMQSIPQYELPEINENGDIIIRRKRWPADDDPGELDDSQARAPRLVALGVYDHAPGMKRMTTWRKSGFEVEQGILFSPHAAA